MTEPNWFRLLRQWDSALGIQDLTILCLAPSANFFLATVLSNKHKKKYKQQMSWFLLSILMLFLLPTPYFSSWPWNECSHIQTTPIEGHGQADKVSSCSGPEWLWRSSSSVPLVLSCLGWSLGRVFSDELSTCRICNTARAVCCLWDHNVFCYFKIKSFVQSSHIYDHI